MRDERVIYVAGHPLLNRRCTRLPGCICFQNDLYCVGWGVNLYSLTQPGRRGVVERRKECTFQRNRLDPPVVRITYRINAEQVWLQTLPCTVKSSFADAFSMRLGGAVVRDWRSWVQSQPLHCRVRPWTSCLHTHCPAPLMLRPRGAI